MGTSHPKPRYQVRGRWRSPQSASVARRMLSDGTVYWGGGIYEVADLAGYCAVNLNRNTCECEFWRSHRKPCVHIKIARRLDGGRA